MRRMGIYSCVLSTLLACNQREVSQVDPAPEVETGSVVEATRQNLDLIFVIDDSGSMKEEQESLAANFSEFIGVLDGVEGGLPNLHVGIVSTNVGGPVQSDDNCAGNGDSGRFINSPRVRGDCSGPSESFFVDVDDGVGGRQKNFSGELSDAFGCVAELGIDGCGFEQPLEALDRALANPANTDFLRPDSLLAVVFITDEDDCSMHDDSLMDASTVCDDNFDTGSCPLGAPSSFRCFEFGVECEPDDPRSLGTHESCKPREDSPYLADVLGYSGRLKALRSSERVFVAGITGTLDGASVQVSSGGPAPGRPTIDPSCESGVGEAFPPIRLAAFLEQFENTGQQSICEANLAPALEKVATGIGILLGNPCVRGNVDIDPSTPEVEVECSVADVVFDGSKDVETILPRCGNGDEPCWIAERDPLACPDTLSQVAIRIRGRDESSGAGGRRTVARCVEVYKQQL